MSSANLTRSAGRFIGRALPRFEDLRFVTGQGRYTDDFHLEGELFAAFVRSPHPHARILSVDVARALACDGVHAALTGRDYLADGCSGIVQVPVPADALRHDQPAFSAADDVLFDVPHLPLAVDVARYLGEAIAVVIADTAWRAREAAERVFVAYDVLPAVVDVEAALSPAAPRLWEGAPGNVAVEATFGDRQAALGAIATAPVIVSGRFRNQRIVNSQMEPRSVIASFDAGTQELLMIAGSQGAARQRMWLAAALKLPIEHVRVICPDTGGGFGPRTNLYPEQAIAAWAARRLNRPVRWTSDRSEAFLADFQGRDSLAEARLGLGADGRILGYDVDLLFAIGGQTVSYVPLSNASRILTTVYDVPVASSHVRGILTNTVPTAPYRGAGRPEATFIIERLLDMGAKRIGLDRVDIRSRNLVRRDQLPYRSPMGLTYDSGDFAGNLRQALKLSDWRGFAERRTEAARRGRLAGIGLSNYIESPVGAPHERVRLSVRPNDIVEMVVGTQSTGQGHETSFAQVAADYLQVAPDQIRIVSGDTRVVALGGGSHSDRSMRLAGALIVQTSAEIIAKARGEAARLLNSSDSEIVFEDGLFLTAESNRRLTLFDIAREPPLTGPQLVAEATFSGRLPAHPTGCAVCELEVDPDTGVVEVTRYTSIDDVGQPINPLILHGQVHGGIAQGLGQVLSEGVVYDGGNGQALTGSFMDYAMPRADMLPPFEVALVEDPTIGNALRVKGGGESGITPALAASVNALMDALSAVGVEDLEMPATPSRVWAACQAAKGR